MVPSWRPLRSRGTDAAGSYRRQRERERAGRPSRWTAWERMASRGAESARALWSPAAAHGAALSQRGDWARGVHRIL